MKRLMQCALLTVLMALTGAQPLAASGDGWGAFLDWLNELSGPEMLGWGVTGWFSPGESNRVHVRSSASWLTSGTDSKAVTPAGSKVTMWSFRPAVEFAVAGPLALGGGVSIDRFGGDADSFMHLSYPVYAQLRFRVIKQLHASLMGGVQYFPAFDADDFAPIDAGVSTDGGETPFWVRLGLEIIP